MRGQCRACWPRAGHAVAATGRMRCRGRDVALKHCAASSLAMAMAATIASTLHRIASLLRFMLPF